MPENIAALSASVHDKCRHKHYRMTCQQFDDLLEEADGRCQVCRLPGSENSRQMLFIDHEAWRGNWAVRGLLCNVCNTILGKDNEVPRNDAFARYLANSWFIRMLAERGITPDLPDEPPVGSVVDFGGLTPQRMRTAKGWERVIRGHPFTPMTWRQLYRSYGPHRLTVVHVGDGKAMRQLWRYCDARRF